MRRRRLPRGSMLLAALLISSILLIMGIAMLVVSSRSYSEVQAEHNALQARLLAEAGVDDVMVKLSKDVGFPPPLGDRKTFAFAEYVYEPDVSDATARPTGSYSVVIDVTRREGDPKKSRKESAAYDYPQFTVRISSTGNLFSRDADTDPARPIATRRLDVELDVSPKKRGVTPSSSEAFQPADATSSKLYYTNPSYYRFLKWEDSGTF